MKIRIRLPQVQNRFFSLSLLFSAVNYAMTFTMLWRFGYYPMYMAVIVLIPVTYTLIFSIWRRFTAFFTPGAFAIHLIAFLRYMILPFSVLTAKSLSQMGRSNQYLGYAVLITIVEMLFIFGAFMLCNPEKVVRPAKPIRFPHLIKIAALLAFAFFLIDNSVLVGNLSVFSGKVTVNTENSTPGVVSIIWQALCVFIFCFIIDDISTNRLMHKRTVLLSIGCSLVYLLIIFTGQVDLSRWYSVVSLIAIWFWLLKLYPNRRRSIFLVLIIPVAAVLFIASQLKNSSVSLSSGLGNILQDLLNPTNLDSYFAGPVSISNAIGTKQLFEPDIASLPFDILNNFPILTHYIEHTHASVNYYAFFMGRSDQILPLVGQSFIWFGYALTPLLSVLSVIMTKHLDARFEGTSGISAYLFGFFAVWCALMPVLNLTIWLSWIYARIIPAAVVFYLVTMRSQPRSGRLRGRYDY